MEADDTKSLNESSVAGGPPSLKGGGRQISAASTMVWTGYLTLTLSTTTTRMKRKGKNITEKIKTGSELFSSLSLSICCQALVSHLAKSLCYSSRFVDSKCFDCEDCVSTCSCGG